ncbi:MAG: Clp1/GlmU family protein [Crenarchaeota archaeon]|nr:Clp1/GlmU family protein [Thermoproteota archaeon]MCR8471156.1 Clp1/GlmU family protein [Thermoproteota archaeon]MCR8472306.1 Clp1/GlmU family protein [Thermoproteota archaeon]MCR8473696.1 Clp1/GlmU family protein [Thermoproteota archaeon]MCR8488472.1 Clp1/GlmU family protein [Thermoproteota archaeon]
MRLRVCKGRNIFLVGYLKIRVLSGTIDIFGKKFKENETAEIKRLTSAPLVALEDSDIEIEFGPDGYIAGVNFELLPQQWRECVNEILGLKVPAKVLVIADVDSGKSGFICYAANSILEAGKKVVIINTDTGQSEMNPPTTIGLACVENQIIHLSELKHAKAFFVGSTSPAGLFNRSITGVIKMLLEAQKLSPDFILINTTGWVHGPGGRELKETKLLAIDPDYIVFIEKVPGELEYLTTISSKLGKRFKVIPAAPRLRTRGREERRDLRKQYYTKEFEGAREIYISTDDVAFMYSYFGTGLPLDAEELMIIAQTLGFVPEYSEKTPDLILIITERNIPQEKTELLSKKLGRQVRILQPSAFENLLVGLLDENANLLASGIIRRFDPASRTLSILTKVDPEKVRIIALGRIKVTQEMEEVEWLEPWYI